MKLCVTTNTTKKTKPVKDTPKKPTTQKEKSASQRISDSLKKPNNSDKGVENQFWAEVEERLRGWPEQANFAGSEVSIWIKIFSNGKFEFKIKHLSANQEFNESLIAYLKQLQEIGLNTHNAKKPYEKEVVFEATE